MQDFNLPLVEPIEGGGRVVLEEMLGDDLTPARVARISYGYAGEYGSLMNRLNDLESSLVQLTRKFQKGCVTGEQLEARKQEIEKIRERMAELDRKLLKTLLDLGHYSPFEQQVFRFCLCGIPMYVGEQILRHRIASPLKRSFRYTRPDATLREDAPLQMLNEFMHIPPEMLGIKKTGKFNPTPEELEELADEIRQHVIRGFNLYEKLRNMGLRKEAARTVLPWGLRTEFYWTINMRSLFNFLDLRLQKAAQWETRQVAKAVARILLRVVPITASTYMSKKGLMELLEV